MNLPKMVKVKQNFPVNKIDHIEEHLHGELEKNLNLNDLKRGASIAITVGSRGISNNVQMVKKVVDYLKQSGFFPFVIGAMGSHGGGTPEGQLDVLNSLGFYESTVGCPVVTSSTVVEVAKTSNGFSVYCDKKSWESDGIIVMNRIKLHTAFSGPHESGLLKMINVGLGKAKGASQLHRQSPVTMSETIKEVGERFLETGKIIAGIAIVENSRDDTAHLNVIKPENIVNQEKRLLAFAKEYFPKLPVDDLDLLIIKNMGKNFSGTGMDTNVIGRMKIFGVPEPEKPRFSRIAVLDLDDASHGNANGIGLADFTTEKLYQKFDRDKTYLNSLTSTYVQRAMIPIIMKNDQETIQAAIKSLAVENVDSLRVAVINNTLDLEYLYLSNASVNDCHENIEILSENVELTFNQNGKLKLG